jgi:hypothetical protein
MGFSTKTKIFSLQKLRSFPAWWHMPVIPALGKLRHEDQELEDSLQLYKKTLSQNKNK